MSAAVDVRFDPHDADPENLEAARRHLLTHGLIVLGQLFSPERIAALRAEYQRGFEDLLHRRRDGRLLSIGPRRLHATLRFTGAFLDADFYANPFIDRLARSLLGDDLIVSTIAAATSFPGAPMHKLHRDQALLFGDSELSSMLPPVSLCVAVNLVQTDAECGATGFAPGSHRDTAIFRRQAAGDGIPLWNPPLQLGDAVIWDNRLVHCGLPNRSNVPRPMLLTYLQCNWFHNGYIERDAALQIAAEDLERIAPEFRARFTWRQRQPPRDLVTTTAVGRMSPCPCGSQLRFKSCCGAALTAP